MNSSTTKSQKKMVQRFLLLWLLLGAIHCEFYNESHAIYSAYVTAIAYCLPANIMNWDCIPCQKIGRLQVLQVVDSKRDEFQGFVAYNAMENSVYISFRGSINLANWLDNLTFYKSRVYPGFPNVLVHRGFYVAYMSVAKPISDAVHKAKLKYPNATFHVTGHSLGAAVAALCAFDLKVFHGIPISSMYTFGQPRIGNAAFKNAFSRFIPNQYRLTHYRDMVPHVPTELIGFIHLRQEIYYNEESSMYTVCNDSDGEDPNCADQCGYFHCNSIVDHLRYVNVTMSHVYC